MMMVVMVMKINRNDEDEDGKGPFYSSRIIRGNVCINQLKNAVFHRFLVRHL